MKALFDTSVLVAGLIEAHPMHERAFPWLERARSGGIELVLAAHSVAELYSILTTLPIRPRVSPETALQLVDETLSLASDLIALSGLEYRKVIARTAKHALVGGVTYDALLAHAAQEAKVDHLITFDERDFRRVWPDDREVILVP